MPKTVLNFNDMVLGAADFYDVSSEASVTLTVVTTLQCLPRQAEPSAAMRDHAKRIIQASGSRSSSVRYLAENSFHDRYVAFSLGGEPVVLSLSNSWNGTVNNFDLFVQELNLRNAEVVLQTIENLKRRAKAVLSGEEFSDLFERVRHFAKPDEPSSDQISAAWEQVTAITPQTAEAVDGELLGQSLRRIGAADYFGVRRIDDSSIAQMFTSLGCLDRSTIAHAAVSIVTALEETRQRFEGGQRRLTGQPFVRLHDDPSYWMDCVEKWEAAYASTFHASEAGWNAADLLALSVLLNTDADAVAEVLEEKGVFEELSAFAWGIGAAEFGPDVMRRTALRCSTWPFLRLASCWWRFDKLQFPLGGKELEDSEILFNGLTSIADDLPASEVAVFQAHADRRLYALRGRRPQRSTSESANSFTANWEKLSLDKVSSMPNALRETYLFHRFGRLLNRDPEGLVEYISRYHDVPVIGRALSNALSSDSKAATRLLGGLKIAPTSPIDELELSEIPWLTNDHAFCFSHLCMWLWKAGLAPEVDLSEALVAITSAFKLPLRFWLGTGAGNENSKLLPHLFVILNVLAYRSLDALNNPQLAEEGLPQTLREQLAGLTIAVLHSASNSWATAAFLLIDAATLVIGPELLEGERYLLRPEHLVLLLSAFPDLLPQLGVEYRRLSVLGGEIDGLSFVTSVVYAALTCHGLYKKPDPPGETERTFLLAAIEELQRVAHLGENLSRLVSLAVAVIRSPQDDAKFIECSEGLSSHRTFGVLSALAIGK